MLTYRQYGDSFLRADMIPTCQPALRKNETVRKPVKTIKIICPKNPVNTRAEDGLSPMATK